MTQNPLVKEKVIELVAAGRPWGKLTGRGAGKWLIQDKVVHVRFRTSPRPDGVSFSYHINPNTLQSDYEVWICGSHESYYLMPISLIYRIYNDPDAYIDHSFPSRRLVEVDCESHLASTAKGPRLENFRRYFLATFDDFE